MIENLVLAGFTALLIAPVISAKALALYVRVLLVLSFLLLLLVHSVGFACVWCVMRPFGKTPNFRYSRVDRFGEADAS